MANTTIDTLEVKVSANAKSATDSLKSLAGALKKVRNALTGVNKDGLKATDHIAKSLNEMNGALNTLSTNGVKKLQKLANGLNDFADAAKKLKGAGDISKPLKAAEKVEAALKALDRAESTLKGSGKDGESVSDYIAKNLREIIGALNTLSMDQIDKLDKLASAMKQYGDALKVLKSIKGGSATSRIKEVSEAMKKGLVPSTGESADVDMKKTDKDTPVDAEWKQIKEKVKTTQHLLGGFIKSIARIALYRAIRSALKAVSEAFGEGLKNAYLFSKQTKGFERLAETMDRIASITYQMKNQLGAFWGEVRQAVLPVIEWAVEKLRALTEWLTELFAAINGQTQYQYALYVEQSWEDATGALKEYKQQLLGLDELNVLSTQTKSTKKKDEDHSKDYELRDVRDSWKNLHTDLSIIVDKIIPDFDNFTSADLEKILVAGLLGIAGLVMDGVPGALIGILTGVGIELVLDELLPAKHSYEYTDKKILGELLLPGITGLLGGLIGAEAGLKGAVVGFSVGATIGFVLERLLPFEAGRGKYAKQTLFNRISGALGVLAGGIIGWELGKGGAGKKIKTALVGMTIGAILTIAINRLTNFEDDSGENEESVLAKMRDTLNAIVGVVGAAVTGAQVANIFFHDTEGKILGATVAVALTLLFRKITNEDGTGDNSKTFVDKLLDELLTPIATAGAVGLITLRATKDSQLAVIAASVTITLELLYQSILHENKTGEGSESFVGKIVSKVLTPISGGATGAMIAWRVTKDYESAIIGATVGAVLAIWVKQIFTNNTTGMDAQGDDLLQMIIDKVLAPIAGGIIGGAIGFYLTGSKTGAVMGANIGVSVTLLIEKLGFSFSKALDPKRSAWDIIRKRSGFDDITVDEFMSGVERGDYLYIGEGIYIQNTRSANKYDDRYTNHMINMDAAGGIERPGSIFVAGEAGPEFVGRMGNNTAIANTGQMTDAIYKAAYMGMSQALRENGNGMSGFVPATTDDLFIAMKKKASRYNKATGNSAFA